MIQNKTLFNQESLSTLESQAFTRITDKCGNHASLVFNALRCGPGLSTHFLIKTLFLTYGRADNLAHAIHALNKSLSPYGVQAEKINGNWYLTREASATEGGSYERKH